MPVQDDTISSIITVIKFELPISQAVESLHYCVVTSLFYISAVTIKIYLVSYLNCA